MDIYQGQEAFAREHHGYCDSYFVESHEDQERRRRDDIRECERQRKRNTQIALAQHLSDLASQEYRDEHLREMEKMEVGTMLTSKPSKQLTYVAQHTSGCCIHRHSDRNQMVHETVPA